jgi:hypothetical protein
LKATEVLMNVHMAQIMNYLKATEIEVGLLLNFGEEPEFKRVIYTNDRKNNLKNQIGQIRDILTNLEYYFLCFYLFH